MTRVGITGHQSRDGLDWVFAENEITKTLATMPRPLEGLTSLAVGADQLFARLVLEEGGQLIAVIPAHDYETNFEGASLISYLKLLQRSKRVPLPPLAGNERAFLRAGRWIVDHCDEMIAVWDGEPSEGLGGTADVVAYALAQGRPCLHINPFARTTRRLTAR